MKQRGESSANGKDALKSASAGGTVVVFGQRPTPPLPHPQTQIPDHPLPPARVSVA